MPQTSQFGNANHTGKTWAQTVAQNSQNSSQWTTVIRRASPEKVRPQNSLHLERRLVVSTDLALKGLNKINEALEDNKIKNIYIVSAVPSKTGRTIILTTGTGQ